MDRGLVFEFKGGTSSRRRCYRQWSAMLRIERGQEEAGIIASKSDFDQIDFCLDFRPFAIMLTSGNHGNCYFFQIFAQFGDVGVFNVGIIFGFITKLELCLRKGGNLGIKIEF